MAKTQTQITPEILQRKLQKRNWPPKSGIRIPHDVLTAFIAALFEKVGTSQKDAHLMGTLLVQNDLRCVFSHGTNKAPQYLRQMRDGHKTHGADPHVTRRSRFGYPRVLSTSL